MSTPNESIDLEHFQQQAAQITDQLQEVWSGYDVQRSSPLGALSADEKNQIVEDVLNQIYEDATTKKGAVLGSREEVRAAALEVRSALHSPTTREKFCRGLQALTGKSSREITIEVVKLFLPLVIAGQIVFPLSTLAWGILGFTIACVGTTWLCGEKTDAK